MANGINVSGNYMDGRVDKFEVRVTKYEVEGYNKNKNGNLELVDQFQIPNPIKSSYKDISLRTSSLVPRTLFSFLISAAVLVLPS